MQYKVDFFFVWGNLTQRQESAVETLAWIAGLPNKYIGGKHFLKGVWVGGRRLGTTETPTKMSTYKNFG